MYGKGLLIGLKITLEYFFKRKITQKYPEEKPVLPERARCFLELDPEKCTACNICVNVCPNNVIKIESVRGEDKKRRLVSYEMRFDLCLFCGLCVEACNFGALKNVQEFEHASFRREDTVRSFISENGREK